MIDPAHLGSVWDDIVRDITRRIRDLDLLPYEEAKAIAESSAHQVVEDVKIWMEKR